MSRMPTRALWTSPAGQPLVWIVACLVPLVSTSFLVTKKPALSNDGRPVDQPYGSLSNTYQYLKHDTAPSTISTTGGTILACSACNGEYHRLKQTPADHYYAQHHQLPRPTIMHAKLPVNQGEQQDYDSKNILVVGDVHGCMVELQSLLEKAVRDHNDGRPFSFIILVGDLCNKGPQSAEVIRWARSTPNVLTVRGNHDDGALEAALGDAVRRKKEKYQWVMEGELEPHLLPGAPCSDRTVLSDGDVTWLAELPYTLTIPGWYLGQPPPQDTVIVHAGLIPKLPLEQQSIATMITIREVLPICDKVGGVTHFEYHERQKGKPTNEGPEVICGVPSPWARAWNGPQRVIFGHDARRGFQRYKGNLAIGLDTGAVYGKGLTGLILPAGIVVSVPSRPHSRVDKSDGR